MTSPNPIATLYYKKYRNSFRLGSYVGFIRGFCAKPIAPYLIGESQLNADTMQRLSRSRDAVRTMVIEGLDSDAANKWFQTMAHGHKHVALDDTHYLYVLANFYLEPLRVLRQQHKNLTKQEHAHYLAFWNKVAAKMQLTNIPTTYPQWLTLSNNYEREHAGASAESKLLMQRCLYLVVNFSIPFGFRGISRRLIINLLPQKHRDWFGLAACRWLRVFVRR